MKLEAWRIAQAIPVAAALLHVATAGLPDIYDELPGQYAGTAREMAESGSWLIPSLDGIPRLQKPPLAYWLTAASLSLLGRSEFAARLPTALSLAGLTLVTYALGARLYGHARGVAAAAILGTSFGTVALGKLIMPEPFLALGIAASLLAAVRCVDDPLRQGRWSLAVWGAAAFATLSKGLHGLLLPAVVLALVATLSPGSRRPLLALARPSGVALYLALVLPWPLYVESQFPGYLRDNLLNEQLGHLLDTHFPRDSEPTPLALLWAQHLVWWFPWVFFAVAALLNRAEKCAHPVGALPTVWLLTTSVAASLSGQRQDYHTMFAWPAFALLVSRAWDCGSDRRGMGPALALPLGALALLAMVGLAVYAVGGAEPPDARATSAPFGARNSVMGVISGISAAEWRRLRPLLLPGAGGLLVGAAGALALAGRRETRQWSWAPLAVGALGPLLAAGLGLQAFAPLFGLKPIAVALNREAPRGGIVVYDGPSRRASSLCFYVDVSLRWLERPETEFAVRSRGIGHDRFVTEAEVVARWRAGEPVWLITEESRLDHWRALVEDRLGDVVARSGTRVLVGNSPGG
ncbi:MAG: glycosyltransferase family 39 protein [Candidatus Rokubacteria bacterium]|nr:glycosyltransferase family 39 protein [Candidatus Rokubacteria bacterium]